MRKLRREDLQVLDDFLARLPGEDAMLLSKLDGYLAGIIVCPRFDPAKRVAAGDLGNGRSGLR